MNNLDYNEIKIFINLEIIGEEKLYLFFFLMKIIINLYIIIRKGSNLDCNKIMIFINLEIIGKEK